MGPAIHISYKVRNWGLFRNIAGVITAGIFIIEFLVSTMHPSILSSNNNAGGKTYLFSQ